MKTGRKMGKDRLVWMYTQMVRIREFEEAVKRTFIEHPGRNPRTFPSRGRG